MDKMTLYNKCMAATRIVKGDQYAHELCQASAFGNTVQMLSKSKSVTRSRSKNRSKSRRNRERALRVR